MAPTKTFSTEIPQRLLLTVDVPQRLSTRNVNQTVEMFSSRLRFLLGQQMRRQTYARVLARCAAKELAAQEHAAGVGIEIVEGIA
jgi:hypothetical protein